MLCYNPCTQLQSLHKMMALMDNSTTIYGVHAKVRVAISILLDTG